MMDHAGATREVYWNISHIWLMYVLFFISIGVASAGLYRRIAAWRCGLPVHRSDHPLRRFGFLLKHALAQARTLRDSDARIFHTFIYAGFLILTAATTVVLIDADFHIHIMRGSFYLYFQSLTVDVFGVLVIVGIVVAASRRFMTRPRKLVYTREAGILLLLIFVICATGFLLEGWRIAATHDPWAAWSPAGHLVARISQPLMSEPALRSANAITWWIHAALVFGFLAWAPYTKMLHAITAPANIFTAWLEPIGAILPPVDFNNSEVFGAKSLAQFNWKDLLDLDACTECGRCDAACPASRVGKSLSPRDLILDLRGIMRGHVPADGNRDGPAMLQGAPPARWETVTIAGGSPSTGAESLWACTTCAACMQVCPVFIEQMPKIVGMRRYLVMEEADYPPELQAALSSIQARGHPFRGTSFSRVEWTHGLNVPDSSHAAGADVLFWAGCAGAFVERNHSVLRAITQLLERAGVKYFILGNEEGCSGDLARRVGDEFLFQQLAERNIETFRRYHVRHVVTACPHCFNAFRNEYPRHGGRFQVHHHSEYLARLIQEGRLSPVRQIRELVTYHDPCYLGRQNGIYDAPRSILQAACAHPLREMKEARDVSFCCGGGGGMSFVDEPRDKRVNQERAGQALATGCDVVAVGCPFCVTMLDDGIKSRQQNRLVRVSDVAEILLQATE